MEQTKLEELFEEVMNKRNQILDDFLKAYIAENTSVNIKDLILVEEHDVSGAKVSWYFKTRD